VAEESGNAQTEKGGAAKAGGGKNWQKTLGQGGRREMPDKTILIKTTINKKRSTVRQVR